MHPDHDVQLRSGGPHAILAPRDQPRPGAKSHPVHARARLEHSWPAAVSNARGRGFVAAIDLATRELRTSVLQKLWSEEHVIAFACGERTLRLRPALSMTAEDAKAGPRR